MLVPAGEFGRRLRKERVIVRVRVHIAGFCEAHGHGREIEAPRVRDGDLVPAHRPLEPVNGS